jgi:thioredoxin 1
MLMHVKEKADFDNQIKEGKVLVDFFATWCGPCKMLSPLVESLSKEHDELKVLKVDVDEAEAIAAEYNIYSIPTLIYSSAVFLSPKTPFPFAPYRPLCYIHLRPPYGPLV